MCVLMMALVGIFDAVCRVLTDPSQIANLLVNATALGLTPGWHSLQVDMQQRSTVEATLGQPRRST